MAAAGTIGAGAIGAIQDTVGQAHDALAGVVPYLDAAKWGLLAVTLIGIGIMLWARIDDRRMGLMGLLLQGWLLRNVLSLLGWRAAAAAVAAVLFGARQAGRNAERVENMRRTVEVQRDQLAAASRRPRDRGELARRMHDGTF